MLHQSIGQSIFQSDTSKSKTLLFELFNCSSFTFPRSCQPSSFCYCSGYHISGIMLWFWFVFFNDLKVWTDLYIFINNMYVLFCKVGTQDFCLFLKLGISLLFLFIYSSFCISDTSSLSDINIVNLLLHSVASFS